MPDTNILRAQAGDTVVVRFDTGDHLPEGAQNVVCDYPATIRITRPRNRTETSELEAAGELGEPPQLRTADETRDLITRELGLWTNPAGQLIAQVDAVADALGRRLAQRSGVPSRQ